MDGRSYSCRSPGLISSHSRPERIARSPSRHHKSAKFLGGSGHEAFSAPASGLRLTRSKSNRISETEKEEEAAAHAGPLNFLTFVVGSPATRAENAMDANIWTGPPAIIIRSYRRCSC